VPVSYVERNLNPGEQVVHSTTLHPIIFAGGALLTLFSFVFFTDADLVAIGLVILVLGLLILTAAWLRFAFSEFAVTSSRVVIKVGLVSRRTLELQLSKVEAIAVDQGLLGRVLDYGTLVVGGTGGTKEAFKHIKSPVAFRGAVQHQTELSSRLVVAPALAAGGRGAVDIRQERECPYCAERILAKASRCRFCGQTVTPTV
jgi:uncharacterized membrane protein YdbT with pleckstrin-like domain